MDLEALAGEVVDGRFKLSRFIGKGAGCVLYQAQHLLLNDRQMAIKIFSDGAASATESQKEYVRASGHYNGLAYIALDLGDAMQRVSKVDVAFGVNELAPDFLQELHDRQRLASRVVCKRIIWIAVLGCAVISLTLAVFWNMDAPLLARSCLSVVGRLPLAGADDMSGWYRAVAKMEMVKQHWSQARDDLNLAMQWAHQSTSSAENWQILIDEYYQGVLSVQLQAGMRDREDRGLAAAESKISQAAAAITDRCKQAYSRHDDDELLAGQRAYLECATFRSADLSGARMVVELAPLLYRGERAHHYVRQLADTYVQLMHQNGHDDVTLAQLSGTQECVSYMLCGYEPAAIERLDNMLVEAERHADWELIGRLHYYLALCYYRLAEKDVRNFPLAKAHLIAAADAWMQPGTKTSSSTTLRDLSQRLTGELEYDRAIKLCDLALRNYCDPTSDLFPVDRNDPRSMADYKMLITSDKDKAEKAAAKYHAQTGHAGAVTLPLQPK